MFCTLTELVFFPRTVMENYFNTKIKQVSQNKNMKNNDLLEKKKMSRN